MTATTVLIWFLYGFLFTLGALVCILLWTKLGGAIP
jgi:hypothetical protein